MQLLQLSQLLLELSQHGCGQGQAGLGCAQGLQGAAQLELQGCAQGLQGLIQGSQGAAQLGLQGLTHGQAAGQAVTGQAALGQGLIVCIQGHEAANDDWIPIDNATMVNKANKVFFIIQFSFFCSLILHFITYFK